MALTPDSAILGGAGAQAGGVAHEEQGGEGIDWSPAASVVLELALRAISTAALAELLELTARMLHSRGYAKDLFPAQWMALRYFAKAPPEKRTASELARFQGLANGPVSRTVRTLVQKELLTKAKEQPRGRAEVLELTDAGREALLADPTLEIEEALAALPNEHRQVLARALETILRRVPTANGHG
jgi:DNA-binding MarR family transcriptional regulator